MHAEYPGQTGRLTPRPLDGYGSHPLALGPQFSSQSVVDWGHSKPGTGAN
jgi:hypothetical protein